MLGESTESFLTTLPSALTALIGSVCVDAEDSVGAGVEGGAVLAVDDVVVVVVDDDDDVDDDRVGAGAAGGAVFAKTAGEGLGAGVGDGVSVDVFFSATAGDDGDVGSVGAALAGGGATGFFLAATGGAPAACSGVLWMFSDT